MNNQVLSILNQNKNINNENLYKLALLNKQSSSYIIPKKDINYRKFEAKKYLCTFLSWAPYMKKYEYPFPEKQKLTIQLVDKIFNWVLDNQKKVNDIFIDICNVGNPWYFEDYEDGSPIKNQILGIKYSTTKPMYWYTIFNKYLTSWQDPFKYKTHLMNQYEWNALMKECENYIKTKVPDFDFFLIRFVSEDEISFYDNEDKSDVQLVYLGDVFFEDEEYEFESSYIIDPSDLVEEELEYADDYGGGYSVPYSTSIDSYSSIKTPNGRFCLAIFRK